MTTLDELFSVDAGLRVQQAAYRKSMLEDMAYAVATDLRDGKARREVALPVLAGFIKGIIPAGKGQADKADTAANKMVDEMLATFETAEKTVDAVASEAEEPEVTGETGLEVVEPEEVTEEVRPARQRRSA